MGRLIDPNLQKISALMSEMGDLAIQSLEIAIGSYLKGTNPVSEVKELSKHITHIYHNVGHLLFYTILKFQPVESDFRLIRSSIDISYTFHRFGRYAYDITLVRDKFGDISECKNEWIYQVTDETLRMAKDALQAFALLDIRRTDLIRINEEYVDRLYRERIPMLISSQDTKCALAEAMLLGYLERIADHAVSMGRAVNYIVTGEHTHKDI